MSEAIRTLIESEFRWLHQHPELSYQEFETTARLKSVLTSHGIRVLETGLKTGLVAEIGSGAPVIAIRCDIDALPVTEESGLSYSSLHKGVMHACGHDFHAAAVLGAALYLKENEKNLKGTVRLVFQPAEEAPGGARKVLESGALNGVREIYGIHTIPAFEPGTVALRAGASHAAVDRFSVTFRGHGTHAAHPDLGIDTVLAASHFVTAVQSVVSRNSNPFASNLISVTHFEGGNTWNVIPETVFLEGTVRTMTKKDRALVKERLEKIAEGTAETFGLEAEVTWGETGLPPMNNDAELTEFAARVARENGLTVETAPASLGGEDFALYEEAIPGAFVMIGTGPSAPNHNPGFIADPRAMDPAARFLADLAEKALLK